MDSSSSGSLPSSSGGGGGNGAGSHEEEYTSAPNHEILSPFLPLNSSTDQYQYPFSNYQIQDHFPLNPNSILSRTSLDSPHWPSSTPLIPSCTNNNAQLLNSVTSAASVQPPVASENRTMAPANSAPTRGPKKRSRASRRPPTTVLTTDTSNFRAMVQEFTGFPAAPFVPASPFVRPRLNTGLGLFQSGSNSALGSPYLLRPFPQKLQTNPCVPQNNLSSSTIVDAIASIARSNGNLANLNNTMFGASNATSTSSSGSNTNFVNASTTSIATTSSTDPISNFLNLHSHHATNSKYNFAAQGDLDGLVGSNGSNPMRLACDGFEPDKSRFASLEAETQAMEKGIFGFLNYADLKDKRSLSNCTNEG
ncbi:VQ motif-containing protein [Carex littledalei]|uniref:VQ motif-containing protein n=1 Tax=Carex littledalei TaxID=544730 RepID=A0A833QQI8_9POAL|nr:VQ motif-containing protein [Carex littledalei]